MKRTVMLLLFLLIIPVVSAEIIVDGPPNTIYNLGDSISISGYVLRPETALGLFSLTLVCDQNLQLLARTISIESNEKILFLESLAIPPITGDNCIIEAKLEIDGEIIERKQSKVFAITRDLDGIFNLQKDKIQLGDAINIKGTITRINGKPINGLATIYLKQNGTNYFVDTTLITNSKLDYSYILKSNPSGIYDADIQANDGYGNQFLFENALNLEIVDDIIVALELDNLEIKPGEKLKISEFMTPSDQESKRFLLIATADHGYELYDEQHQLILRGTAGEEVNRGGFTFKVSELVANANTHFYIFKKPAQGIINSIASRLQIIDLAQSNQMQSKTGVLQMSLTGLNPQEVVTLLNTIAQVTVEKDSEKKAVETTKTLEFLNQQLPIVKKSLDDTESALNNYQAKTGTINLSDEVKILLDQVGYLEKELSEIQIAKAEALQKYTPHHPFILSLNDKEVTTKQQLQLLQQKISQLPISEQTAVGLMRDIKVKSELYLFLLNKIQALQVSKASASSNQ